MRYFFYTKGWTTPAEATVIIVDENSELVTLHPPRGGGYSHSRSTWMEYFDGLNEEGRKTTMFEICENQFKKFAEKGIMPENHDAYFVAQRRKARGYE